MSRKRQQAIVFLVKIAKDAFASVKPDGHTVEKQGWEVSARVH